MIYKELRFNFSDPGGFRVISLYALICRGLVD